MNHPVNPLARVIEAAGQAQEEYQILIALSVESIGSGYQKSCSALHEALAALDRYQPSDENVERMAEWLYEHWKLFANIQVKKWSEAGKWQVGFRRLSRAVLKWSAGKKR